MSQEELAEKAGLDPRHLRRIERATHSLNIVTLVRLAEALDVRRQHLPRGIGANPRDYALALTGHRFPLHGERAAASSRVNWATSGE